MTTTKNKELEEKRKKREIRRINTVRSNREINRELINTLVSMKACTQLTTSDEDWDCAKYPKFGLTKGGQSFCHNPEFLNKCPLINRYINHGITQKIKKIRDWK